MVISLSTYILNLFFPNLPSKSHYLLFFNLSLAFALLEVWANGLVVLLIRNEFAKTIFWSELLIYFGCIVLLGGVCKIYLLNTVYL